MPITIKFKSTIVKFQKKIEELEVENQKLKKDNSQLKKEHKKRDSEQLEKLQKHNEMLQKQLEELKKDNEVLEEQLEELQNENSFQSQMIDGLAWTVTNMTEHVKESSENFTKQIDEQIEQVESYKKKCLLLENQLASEEQRVSGSGCSGSAPKAKMPICEICVRPYDNECPERIPLFLSCGHTLCEECAGKLYSGPTEMLPVEHVNCPFDRSRTLVGEEGLLALPKNFTVMQIVEEAKNQ